MKIIYFLLLTFFCCTFPSAFTLALNLENCDAFNYNDFVKTDSDETYLMLSGASLTDKNLHCIKKRLLEHSSETRFDEIRIFDVDIFEARSSTEILNALGLSSMRMIIFRDSSDLSLTTYNKILERHVSVEHGAQLLFVYLHTGELSADLFRNYGNLKELNLDLSTSVKTHKNLFSNLRNLKILKWQNDKDVAFERTEIERLPYLETIEVEFWFDENKCKNFTLNFHNMSNLKEALLQRTFGNCIEENLFKGARNLTNIKITENEFLKELPVRIFADQENLINLNLQWNSLESAPSELFSSLKKLEFLDLSYNKIAQVYWTWPLLPRLEALDVKPKYVLLTDFNVTLNSSHFRAIDCNECNPNTFRSFKADAFFCESETSCRFSVDRNGIECPKGCECRLERESLDFVIDCNNASLTEFPKLPMSTIGNLTVRMENNSIAVLPNNSFYGYANIENLHVSGNQLTSFSSAQISHKLKFIDLSRNKLTTVDVGTVHALEKRKDFLTIKAAGNPWVCDCVLVPLVQLVKKLNNKVLDIGQLKCEHQGEKLTMVEADEWSICPSNKNLFGFMAVGLVVIICVLIILYLCYSEQVNIWLYEHNWCLRCIVDADLYKNMIYDAFISYSSKDADIIPQFVDNLEKCPNPYRLCLHDRDWLVGDCIPDRISLTVDQSKSIIIILSQNFLDSTWGRMEFRLSIQGALQQYRRRLIIVLYNEPENFDSIDSELRAYLQINTFIRWDDPNFWRKLRYAMPHKEPRVRGTRRSEQNNEVKIEYRM